MTDSQRRIFVDLMKKIAKESTLRDKKEAIIDERRSEKKAPNGAKGSSGKK